jgi:hypothetical protein
MAERAGWNLALRSALWLLLAGWFGSWATFGFVVAPLAFTVLPSTEIAGTLVDPVLEALHLYGAAAGLVLAWLARALRRGPLLTALPLLMSALCLVSHFGVSLQMDEIRDLAFGPQGNLESAALFNRLHKVSMGIFVGVSAAVVALLLLHVKAESGRSPASR